MLLAVVEDLLVAVSIRDYNTFAEIGGRGVGHLEGRGEI